MNIKNTFECDKNKARSNFQKHSIRFTEGCRIFEGHVLTGPSKHVESLNEKRYTTIGMLGSESVAVVVWTKRRANIRVISVRKASRKERDFYYANIKKTVN